MHIAYISAAFSRVARHLNQHIAQQMLGRPAAIKILADQRDDRLWSCKWPGAQLARGIIGKDRACSLPIPIIHRTGKAGEGAANLPLIQQCRQIQRHAVMAAQASKAPRMAPSI